MKEAERKRKILYHQHLTSRCDAQTAARDVLALQAQFLRHAQMSLRLRTMDDSWKQWVKQSVKTRAFRGTLHLLDAEDRLLITSALWKDYEHRKYYMARYYTPQEEQLFCNAILDLLQQGICGRRKIYTRLVAMGLDEKLCELACSSWDGLFAVLNIQGCGITGICLCSDITAKRSGCLPQRACIPVSEGLWSGNAAGCLLFLRLEKERAGGCIAKDP